MPEIIAKAKDTCRAVSRYFLCGGWRQDRRIAKGAEIWCECEWLVVCVRGALLEWIDWETATASGDEVCAEHATPTQHVLETW